MKLVLILLLVSTTQPAPYPKILCQLCEDSFDLLQVQLGVAEHAAEINLGNLVDTLCNLAPRQIPIIDTLCTVLRDDLVEALVDLIKGVEQQTRPDLVCHGYLPVC